MVPETFLEAILSNRRRSLGFAVSFPWEGTVSFSWKPAADSPENTRIFFLCYHTPVRRTDQTKKDKCASKHM